jgi:branched-chain amino acid transport system permease protein
MPLALGVEPYALYVLGTAFLFATLTSAWSLLAQAGQTSFGHAAFFGLGAYASALLAVRGLWPWWGLAAAGLAGAAGALAIGLASARLRGAYLALATLAYAEVWRGIALNWTEMTGGGAGLVGVPALPAIPGLPLDFARGRAGAYYLSLALLVAVLVLSRAIARSRIGLALAAVREEEARASLLGLRPLGWKLLAFALSGLFAGLVGALYVHAVRVIEPDLVFNRHYSILPLVMATVGGLGGWLGPAAAAVGLYLLSEMVLHPLAPAFHQAGYAIALVLVTLYLPGGLARLWRSDRRAHP